MSNYDEHIQGVLEAWQPYIDSIQDWQQLVAGIDPKPTDCGPVYEIPNPIADRANESFAIADMRKIAVAEPHYHTNGETEIYVALQGAGRVFVGMKMYQLQRGVPVVTPPDTTHFTIPQGDLVLAVINTPLFNPENYRTITDTDHKLGFDREQFELAKNETI